MSRVKLNIHYCNGNNNNNQPLKGKVAFITGAGSGIGEATAVAFAKNGCKAIILFGRTRSKLEETARKINAVSQKTEAVIFVGDVGIKKDVEHAFEICTNKFNGQLDFLFNNAGRGSNPRISLEDLDLETINAVINTNLLGAILCTQCAFKLMKPQGYGRIINNGSISAHTPRPNSILYTSTKHAMTGITKSTSLDGRDFNISCGQIDIGNALTPMTAPMKKFKIEPVMDVDDVANACVYMASLPKDANVLFMTVMANQMPFVGRG